jgi:Fur family peroxide stress response transcriptional regulator
MSKPSSAISGYEERISHSGHRLTPQRRGVYDVLLAERDHPTATEVFLRAKKRIPGISLATVYNCLETLVDCGLAKQVNVDRDATRYCANLKDHGHFVCERCGKVHDIPVTKGSQPGNTWHLPKNFSVTQTEVTVRGVCPDCNA